MTGSTPSPDIDSAHYRLLFEAAPDAILVVDTQGVIRMNNAEAERLLGASPAELMGMSVEKLVPLSVRKRHVGLRNGFTRTAHSRPMGMGLSLNAVRLDGREFPVEISLSATEGASGKETIVVMRDVTERLIARRREDELFRAKTLTAVTQLALRERDLSALCDQLTLLLLQPLKADAAVVVFRDGVDGMFEIRSAQGECAEEMRGTNFQVKQLPQELHVPVLVGDAQESSLLLFPTAVSLGFRCFISAPLIDYDTVIGMVGVASRQPHHFGQEDVAVIEAVTNIISTALQRASAEEKLTKSQRLESLGQLTGGVAHDFNNLLTVISGNLQLLEMSLGGAPETARPVAAAQRAARRGAELTAKLLAFARRQTLRPEIVNVQMALNEFLELMTRTLGANIKVEVQCARRTPQIMVDSGALDDALLNLAVNARDAMPSGGTLTILAEAVVLKSADAMVAAGELVAGRYVRLQVKDTGVGMAQETIARVFEPFFTTKAVGKGTGLGLSMVYGFAKQSAGHVTVHSQLNVGTVVSLYLPVADTHARQLSNRSGARAEEGTGEKILVIEDDDDVRDLAVAFLVGLGYYTIAASNRADAVAQLHAHPDTVLVFSDVMLGGNETGPHVWRALLEIKPNLHLLYASGYAKSALPLQLGLDDGVEFLKKPYSRDELALAVQRAIDRPAPT
jgi:PAS domain S-box-containing protein